MVDDLVGVIEARALIDGLVVVVIGLRHRDHDDHCDDEDPEQHLKKCYHKNPTETLFAAHISEKHFFTQQNNIS